MIHNLRTTHLKATLCLTLVGITLMGCARMEEFFAPLTRTNQPTGYLPIPAQQDPNAPVNLLHYNQAQNTQQPPKFMPPVTNDPFLRPVSTTEQRFERVEDAVQLLRAELNKTNLSVQHLIAIEKEMQDLTLQLQILLEETNNKRQAAAFTLPPVKQAHMMSQAQPTMPLKAYTPPPVQKTAKAKPKKQYKPAPPHTGTPLLKTIRAGAHKTKTRIVLETLGTIPYTAELDNTENLLLINLGKGQAHTNIQQTATNTKHIRAASLTPQNEGMVLAISLTGPSRVLKQGTIPPNQDSPYTRIFIDIAK